MTPIWCQNLKRDTKNDTNLVSKFTLATKNDTNLVSKFQKGQKK